jgi:hypothetical protein
MIIHHKYKEESSNIPLKKIIMQFNNKVNKEIPNKTAIKSKIVWSNKNIIFLNN